MTPRDLPWVTLEDSRQWRAFKELVEMLRGDGARLTVIVGPLTEHATGVHLYRALVAGAEDWLTAGGIAFYTPAVLPSELYADLSHPLPTGTRNWRTTSGSQVSSASSRAGLTPAV